MSSAKNMDGKMVTSAARSSNIAVEQQSFGSAKKMVIILSRAVNAEITIPIEFMSEFQDNASFEIGDFVYVVLDFYPAICDDYGTGEIVGYDEFMDGEYYPRIKFDTFEATFHPLTLRKGLIYTVHPSNRTKYVTDSGMHHPIKRNIIYPMNYFKSSDN